MDVMSALNALIHLSMWQCVLTHVCVYVSGLFSFVGPDDFVE